MDYTAPATYTYAQTRIPYQQQQQPSQNIAPSIMAILVNGENDVEMYPVAAGTTVMLISFEKQKFWLKSRGTDGVPQPVRSFPFKEDPMVSGIQNGGVSREEFAALNNKLDKLIAELGGTKE